MTTAPPRVRPLPDLALSVLLLAADALVTVAVMVLMGLRAMGDVRYPGPPPPPDWVPACWFAGLAAVTGVTCWALRSQGWRLAAWTQLVATGLLAVLTAVVAVATAR
ncbi:hypothetical protein [Streptomyces sp. NPDC058955]|uniref:hypothetical protein n=1 Tax=unclassified Streptomyces TaxID=2593676 RepID=UPI003664FCFF